MKNKNKEKNYEEAKRKAKESYDKIDRVWCPPLNDHIVFNSDGFRHLAWKGRERRPQKNQMKRFSLLPYAEQVITSPSSKISYRKKKEYSQVKWRGEKIIIKSDTHFWGFRAKVEEKPIRVIIRQIGNGNKHFLSIFEEEEADQQKTTHE